MITINEMGIATMTITTAIETSPEIPGRLRTLVS